MNLRLVHAGVILAAICPPARCDDTDHLELLDRARAKIVENIRRLPKYTCVQTVHRSRFRTIPASRVKGCGNVDDPELAPRMALSWTDRFKLDVTVSQGAEIFSWAGARSFQTEEVDHIVGGGMTGTGDFGPFLMSVFSNGSAYRYMGLEKDGGRSSAVYRYHVPITASHYQVNVGPLPGDFATMAYEGRLWIDPDSAELNRMTIEVPEPPPASETCRVETTIDYRRSEIGGYDFLLPRLTVLKLWDTEGERHENRIEYSTCREFQTESVFRTDAIPEAGATAEAKALLAIPAGISIKIALRSIIDSETAFAGDPIDGQLVDDIRDRRGRVLAGSGMIVHGRIMRLERRYLPSAYFALGLKFYSMDVNGGETPLTLAAVARSKKNRILLGPIEKREGVGMFVFRDERLKLGREFVSEWKTGR